MRFQAKNSAACDLQTASERGAVGQAGLKMGKVMYRRKKTPSEPDLLFMRFHALCSRGVKKKRASLGKERQGQCPASDTGTPFLWLLLVALQDPAAAGESLRCQGSVLRDRGLPWTAVEPPSPCPLQRFLAACSLGSCHELRLPPLNIFCTRGHRHPGPFFLLLCRWGTRTELIPCLKLLWAARCPKDGGGEKERKGKREGRKGNAKRGQDLHHGSVTLKSQDLISARALSRQSFIYFPEVAIYHNN